MKQHRGCTLALLLLLTLPLLAGCPRSRVASATATPAASPASTAALPQPSPRPETSSLRGAAPAGSVRQSPQAPAPTPPPATPATGPELLASERSAPVAPRDFKIGLLHVPGSRSAVMEEAADTVSRFLEGLGAGKVPEDLVEPRSKDRLERSLAYYTSRGAVAARYRIGELRETGGGELIANVRLYGQAGVTEGEVYLIRSDAAWKIGDLQVGLALLLEPYDPPAEPFLPSTYEYTASSSSQDDIEAGVEGAPRPEKD